MNYVKFRMDQLDSLVEEVENASMMQKPQMAIGLCKAIIEKLNEFNQRIEVLENGK